MSENYDLYWSAYIGKTNFLSAFWKKSLNERDHFKVDGYANAWYVKPQELGVSETFTITLYFNPQSYFYIGLIISGLTFIGCIFYLLYGWRNYCKMGD